MSLKICLLISDDSDDHQAFTEACQDVLPEVVVLAITLQDRAIEAIESGKLLPDVIVLDLAAHEADGMSLKERLERLKEGATLGLAVYGTDEELRAFRGGEVIQFPKEYDFEQLRNILKTIFEKYSGAELNR